MFYDYAKINVKAGDGGNGIVAFRREKYVPKGGPAGGDGGRGGNVIIEAAEGLRTLVDFRYKVHYKGERGEHGQGKSRFGKDGADIVLRVPPGTVVRDADTKQVLADLVRNKQEVIVASGGKGGRGNIRFADSVNRAPTIAENGDAGEERWLELELKVLADVGLVGFPNVGKSTLIAHVSAARPKIADYHFTTLKPNLGVVRVGEGESFVMADIPGLIEGAAEGAGLGHRFLRHIERTGVLVHVLDISGSEGRDPLEDFAIIVKELEKYGKNLSERPFVIAANKMDIPGAAENLVRLKELMPECEVFPISAVTGEGLQALIYRLKDLVKENEELIGKLDYEEEELMVVRYEEEPQFYIEMDEEVYVVKGEEIDKHYRRLNLDSDEGLARFMLILDRMGVIKELRKKGAGDMDVVRIGQMEFDFVD